jgi:hypothetical protein
MSRSGGRWLLVLAAVVGLGILFFFNPATSAFYPFCPLHRMTGLLCPGCGSLRALHQLLHGNVATAFHLNALLVLSLPLLAALAARALYRGYRGCPDSFGISGRVFWAGFAVAILFGILRNF